MLFINYAINAFPIIINIYKIARHMNIFSRLPSFQAFFHNTKQAVRNLTLFAPVLSSVPELKPEKETINDTTMETEAKIDEDSHIYAHSEGSAYKDNISVHQKQYLHSYPKALPSVPEKRHENISYFHIDGNELSAIEGRQIYQAQQTQLRKRRRSFTAETFEHESSRLMKKYISNHWIPKEKEQNYLEIHSEIGKNRNKNIYGDKSKSSTVTKVTFRMKSQNQSSAKKLSLLHPTDLPDIEGYSINYTMQNLSQMSYEEITSLQKLAISTQWGKIQFLLPVSLFRKDVDTCLTFSEESIEIHDEEWKSKPIRLTVYHEAMLNKKMLNKITRSAAALGLTTARYSDRSESLVFSSESMD